MHRYILTILFIIISVSLTGQGFPDGGTLTSAPRKYDPFATDVRTWKIDGRYGIADTLEIDSVVRNNQDNRPDNNYSIANAWNGNLGSPMESKVFFDRYYDSRHLLRHKSDNMFSSAYDAYTILPEDVQYYDSHHPFAQLAYRTAFPTNREEDYVKALFTMNANKFISFGGLCNFIYGRGQYKNQSSNMINGGFFFRYTGKPYELNLSVMFNDYKNRENGGITDNSYILASKDIEAINMPVNFDGAQSKYRDYCYHLNHRYRIGRYMEDSITADSSHVYYQPIVVLAHQFRAEDVRRHYYETVMPREYYSNFYYSESMTHDSTAYWTITNTISATLDESFNKKAKFGLSAFVEYEARHFGVGYRGSEDTATVVRETLHNLCVGAIWSKTQGKYIKYNFNGKVYVVGERTGNFDVNGDLKGIIPFKVRRDSINKNGLEISAGASFTRTSPDRLYYRYYSNHYAWDNPDLKNPLTLDIRGRVGLTVAEQELEFGVNFRNVTNYTYLNEMALPSQHDGNIQVLAIDAKLNLKAWLLHLDTKAVYQMTSNRDVLPLPDVALYSNFYFMHKFFRKVLTLQVGVSVRYHTTYYANIYIPALGQFALQKEQTIGNYPEMNVYLNFHVKTIRFFVQYYNFNKGLFGGSNYLSMSHYPINPGTFQMGLSWNFWN